MSLIELLQVTQHYGVRPVLKNISLQIQPHELVTIIGPNGMGKSTLLRVIAGTLTPQAGTVEIDGLRRKRSIEEELEIRKRVCWLPDHPWLPKERTGREFLASVGRIYDVPHARLLEHIERLLQVFDLLEQGDWPIRSYSNGQQKKIAICGALVTDAPILLLDEPFSGGLDPAGILALKSILRGLIERDLTTIVMTTPVPELLDELADRILVLRAGEIVAFDTVSGLRRSSGVHGSLADVLGHMIHPETIHQVQNYFAEEQS